MIATDLAPHTMSTPPASRKGTAYGRLWRRLPAELAYLVIAFPIALTGFVLARRS